MGDLPDYTLTVETGIMQASSLSGGADAAKSASPAVQDIYLATDTKILYICVAAGAWTGFDFAMLIQGVITLYENMVGGSKRITGLADPTAAQDAATRAYALAQKALCLLLVGGTMSGAIAMGSNKITGLAAPAAATDAARKGELDTEITNRIADVDAEEAARILYVDGKLVTISQAEPARVLDNVYTNSTKIRVVTVSVYASSTNNFTRMDAFCDNTDGATTKVAGAAGEIGSGGNPPILTLTFIVPPSYKYQVQDVANCTLLEWIEWDLH